jgi:hypothetical protein
MTCQRGSYLPSDLRWRKRNRLFLLRRRSLPPKIHPLRLLPARLQRGLQDPHRRSGIHHPPTGNGNPILLHPNAGGTDFVSSYRIIFWSWLSGGFGFKRDDGGGRRRRSHNKRKEGSVMANGCERKMIGEHAGGKFIKVNRKVK